MFLICGMMVFIAFIALMISATESYGKSIRGEIISCSIVGGLGVMGLIIGTIGCATSPSNVKIVKTIKVDNGTVIKRHSEDFGFRRFCTWPSGSTEWYKLKIKNTEINVSEDEVIKLMEK